MERVLVVEAGGEYESIPDAFAAINAAGDATAQAGYVVALAPGTHQLNGPVVLPAHTSIRGSGRDRTVIAATNTTPNALIPIPAATGRYEFADLTLNVTGTDSAEARVFSSTSANTAGTSVRFSNVDMNIVFTGTTWLIHSEHPWDLSFESTTIRIVPGDGGVTATGVRLYGNGSIFTMNNSSLDVVGGAAIGVDVRNTTIAITNSTISTLATDGGLAVTVAASNTTGTSPSVVVRSATLHAPDGRAALMLSNMSTPATIEVVGSRINGSITSAGTPATPLCVSSYRTNHTALTATCS